jgi:hypothetical protein
MSFLKIRSTTPTVGQSLPRGLTTLGFSWLHGRVSAVAVQRGEVTGTWTKDDVPDDLSRIGELVREAARETSYRGSTVSLLLAHPRLAHQLIETAPAKGAALQSMIARQADRAKVFEGPASWSFQTTAGSQNPQSHLLHLLPRTLLDQMVRNVERAGLHLVSVLPPTAVLHGQLTRLPLANDEVAVVAADCGDRVTVVVGRKNGDLLLARSLDANRNKGPANIGVDLSRTILFVSQQFGVNVGSVWLFGPGSAERAAELQPQIHTPIRVSPEPDTPTYWAEDALRLPPEFAPNLISSEQRLAPQRQTLLRVTTLVSLILVCAAAASVAFVQYLSSRERFEIRRLGTRIKTLQSEHLELQKAHTEFTRQEESIRAVIDDRLPPVPAYFLAYLGEAVPADLRLSSVSVKREGPLWHVQMAGYAQTNAAPRAPNALAISVSAFAKVLTNGPFHLRLADFPTAPTAPPSARETASGVIANWNARRANAGVAPTPYFPRDRFNLEGWMQ